MRMRYQTRLFVSAIILIFVLMTAGQITNFTLARKNMINTLVQDNQRSMSQYHSQYHRIMEDASSQLDRMATDVILNYEIRRLDDLSLGSGTLDEIEQQRKDLLDRLYGQLAAMDIYIVTSQRILSMSLEEGEVHSRLYAMEFGSFFNISTGNDFAERYNTLADEDSMLSPGDVRGAVIRALPAEGCFIVGIIPAEELLSTSDTQMAVYSQDGHLEMMLNMDIPPYTMTGETLHLGDGYREILYRDEKITLTYYEDPESRDVCIGRLDYSDASHSLTIALWQGIMAAFVILILSIFIYYHWAKSIMAPLDMFRHIMDTSFDVSSITLIDFQDYFPTGSYNLRARLYGYFMSTILPLALSLTISYGLVSLQGAERIKHYNQDIRSQLVLHADLCLMEGYRLGYRLSNDQMITTVLETNTALDESIILSSDDESRISHALLSKEYFSQALRQVVILDTSMNNLYESHLLKGSLKLNNRSTSIWQITNEGNLLLQQDINILQDGIEDIYGYDVIGHSALNFSNALLDGMAMNHDEVYLLDGQGGILPLEQRGLYSEHVELLLERSLREGSGFEAYIDGQRVQIHLINMNQPGWRVLFVSPIDPYAFLQGIDGEWIYILILAIFFVAALILSIWATETILRPIRRLRSIISVDDVRARLDETLFGRNEFGILAQRYNKMMDRLNVYAKTLQKEEQQRHQLENRRRESEIIALQTQINPHFLYNIFTSIAVLIRSGRTEEAAQMVMDTGNLMRLGVYRGSLMVPLSEEISHVEHYMKLQRIRYLNRVHLIIDCPDTLKGYKVAKFVLQPVVENAIEHGLEDEESTLNIHIRAYIRNDSLILEVDDDGVGIDEEMLNERQKMLDSFRRVSQLGLSNVNERIKLNCGNEYGVNLKKSQLGGLKVILHLPAKQ